VGEEIPAPTCSAQNLISTHCRESPNYCEDLKLGGQLGATFTSDQLPEGVGFLGYIQCNKVDELPPLGNYAFPADCGATRRLRLTLRSFRLYFDAPRGSGFASNSRFVVEAGYSYAGGDLDWVNLQNWDIKSHPVSIFTTCANP
jgi:hypothetical protein